MLTQARLKELIHYDQETGVFTWLVRTTNRVPAGAIAGNVDSVRGYVRINVDQKHYQAHRLAWLYVHGTFPPDQLDHINRVKTDNRLSNLRLATSIENGQNRSLSSRNTSGHVGDSWKKQRQKWMAQIALNGKQTNLGYFTELSNAIAARKSAEPKFHAFQYGDSIND